MALPDLTGQKVNDTYQRLLQISASGDIVDGTGSLFIPPTAISASYASYAVSASHEIIKEVSSSYADTASLAEELVSDKRATVKGYVYVAHGTTLQSGTTAALYLGTSNAGMDVARYNDNTLVLGGVTQYYGWRIFGIKHGLNGSIYTTEIDNLIATGSINVSGSLDISLASGSAFTITEHDIDQQNRLTFEYDQGDPTLIVASRAGTAKLHLKQDLAGNGVEILNTGVFRRTVSSTIYGFSIATTSLQPITTNQLDLGYFNRRWKSVYLYTGNKLSWGTVTATDNVALNNPAGTNTLQITGSSDVTLDVKGNIIATGSLGISGSVNISIPSGSAFAIEESDFSSPHKSRLDFSFSNGDPTLLIQSRADTAKLELSAEQGTSNNLRIDNLGGVYKAPVSNAAYTGSITFIPGGFQASTVTSGNPDFWPTIGSTTRPFYYWYMSGIGGRFIASTTYAKQQFILNSAATGYQRSDGLYNKLSGMRFIVSGSLVSGADGYLRNPNNVYFQIQDDSTGTGNNSSIPFRIGKSGSLAINLNQSKGFGFNQYYTASAMVHVEAEPNYNLDLFRGNNTNGNGIFSIDRDGNISGSDLRVRDGRFQRSPSHAEVEVIGTTDYGLVGTHTNDNFALRRFNITKFTVSESRNVSNQQLHVEGQVSASTYLGDGSQLTGISAGSNLTQSIFVTENGNDTTGTIGDITKPFATLESASLAATTGSTIFVYPGTYTVEANFNLAKPGINYYFYPETTVSKTTAGDMFTMPAGTAGCNIYGQADFILGSSAGSLVQGSYTNNFYSYDFEARDISSDSSTAIVDTFTTDDHVANWKFRIMSSSAGAGFSQSNIYTDGILNIDCQEIITSGVCISTGNGYRGGIIKARKIKSANNFASTFYAGGIGLTLLIDSSEGVGGDNSNCAFRFTNAGTHTLIGDTTGIQLGHGGTVNPFSGIINHTGRCGALAIEGLSGQYNGTAVARCDAFSNGVSSNGVVKFNWTPSGTATDDYLKIHEGNVLATWTGQGSGYSNTIQVTGGKLVLNGYGKDQHAYKGWSVSGGEFILTGIFDKFHNNNIGYGQNQALSVTGGVCKIRGTINMAPHIGDTNQKLINYTGGKLILDGATLITTGSYPVFDLDQNRDVYIFSGGVNTNQTGSNGLLQASGSGYSLTNVLGGMIIEDASVE